MKKKIQKPFNVEAAKNGAKVETRDGKPVRILCYDRVDIDYPIIALITRLGIELCATYNYKGQIHYDKITDSDLVIIEEVEVSKFNPGDWLFAKNGGGHPWLITAVTPNWYEMQDTQGHKDNVSRITVDNYFRLWTLKDAKPGNILADEDGRSFIFRALHKLDIKDYPLAYCGIDRTNSIFIGTGRPWTGDLVRPATFNEKDVLFKKMEEEGYKWDDRTLTLWKKCN